MPVDLTAAVARYGLTSLGTAPVAVDHDAWAADGATIERERLTGLAGAALAAGAITLAADDVRDLASRDRVVQQRTVRAERVTLELTDRLAGLGVPHRVLKGPAVGHRAYADPALRPFRDVDLLIPADAIDHVVRSLVADGATRPVPELRRGFDRRFAKSVTLRHPDGIEIDLHRTLCPGPLAHLIAESELWAEPELVAPVPGRAIAVFDADLTFLHACLHAATGGGIGWLPLRDIVALASPADLERCTALAGGWSASAVVADGLTLAGRRFPPTAELERFAAMLRPTAAERRIAAAYRPDRRSSRQLLTAGFRYVEGLRAKAAYAAALLVPSAEHRRARGMSNRSILGRALGGDR